MEKAEEDIRQGRLARGEQKNRKSNGMAGQWRGERSARGDAAGEKMMGRGMRKNGGD